jgi:hypothetical protein
MGLVNFGKQQFSRGLFGAKKNKDASGLLGGAHTAGCEPLLHSQLPAVHTCAGVCGHCVCWWRAAGCGEQRRRLGGRRCWQIALSWTFCVCVEGQGRCGKKWEDG